MSLFPIIQPQLEEISTTLPLYKEAAWDFVNGKPLFNKGEPVIVTGREAIKTWAYKALLTARAKHEIYSHDFGSEVQSLIGQNYSVATKKAEVIRYCREAIEINPYITDVGNFEVSFSDGDLQVSLEVQTVYGGFSFNHLELRG